GLEVEQSDGVVEKMGGGEREQDQAGNQAEISRHTAAHDHLAQFPIAVCQLQSPSLARTEFHRSRLKSTDRASIPPPFTAPAPCRLSAHKNIKIITIRYSGELCDRDH